MNIKKLNWWIGGATLDEFTNSDGQQVFAIVGDSKAAGTSTSVGPTPTSGTVYQWKRDTTEIVEVGAGDILYVATTGSQWPRFGIDYNAATGKKPILVNNGSGGSKLYDAGGVNTWFTNGTLYSDFKSRTDACLVAAGIPKLKGVFIVLSVNDLAASLADPITYWVSLIDRINADYPDTTIYISLTGAGVLYTQPLVSLYKYAINYLADTYSNVFVTVNESTLFSAGYSGDNVHFNATGNNVFGVMTAAYLASTETDVDLKRIYTSTFINALTVGEKNAITTFVNAQKSNGNWDLLSTLQIYKASSVENVYTDLIGATCPRPVNTLTFSASNYLQSNGTNSYINTQFVESIGMNKGTSTDFIIGCNTVVNATAAGTLASFFGANTAGGATRTYLRQTAASNLVWSTDVAGEDTYTGQTKIQDNTHYAMKRISNTSNDLRSNDVSVDTNASVSAGAVTFPFYIGCRNAASTASEFMNVQVQYFFQAKNTGFNYTQFLSDLTILLAAL